MVTPGVRYVMEKGGDKKVADVMAVDCVLAVLWAVDRKVELCITLWT